MYLSSMPRPVSGQQVSISLAHASGVKEPYVIEGQLVDTVHGNNDASRIEGYLVGNLLKPDAFPEGSPERGKHHYVLTFVKYSEVSSLTWLAVDFDADFLRAPGSPGEREDSVLGRERDGISGSGSGSGSGSSYSGRR